MSTTNIRSRLCAEGADLQRQAHGGGSGHADGRAAASLLAPGSRRQRRCRRHTATGQGAGRRADPVRDGAGRPGLVYPRCCHRGTTLYYGRIEERGIRCCYTAGCSTSKGHCLEMPCEPNPTGRNASARAPACIGRGALRAGLRLSRPAGEKPVLPRFGCLEVLAPGEFVEADGFKHWQRRHRHCAPATGAHFENVVDPIVPILHGTFSGPQFVEQMAAFPR